MLSPIWSAFRRPGVSRGSIALSVFCFTGLSLLDISWSQTLISFFVGMVFLAWCSRPVKDESDEHDYLWGRAISRSVVAVLIVATGATAPFARGHISNDTWTQLGPLLGQAVLFSLVTGSAVYLRDLLRPLEPSSRTGEGVEALKLEHQACLTLFQTMTTAAVVMFIASLLTPTMSIPGHSNQYAVVRFVWVFYVFTGVLVFILRPCMARAKGIRRALAQSGQVSEGDFAETVGRHSTARPEAHPADPGQSQLLPKATDVEPGQPQPASSQESVLLELLKQKQSDAASLIGYVIRGLTLYLAVTGALFKFALDRDSTTDLRFALSVVGLGMCVLGYAMVVMAEKVRPALQSDLNVLMTTLKSPSRAESLQPLKYLHLVCTVLNTFCMGAWTYVLRTRIHG